MASHPSRVRGAPARPGLAKARRIGLRTSLRPPTLSRAAEEALFELAERMSEGSVREGPEGAVYFGSTMFTVELAQLRGRWRGELDAPLLASILEGSVRVHVRLTRIACAEAAHRVPDRGFGTALIETRVRVVGGQLHIDVDLEVPLQDELNEASP